MPFPSPELTGYAPAQVLNGGYTAIDPDLAYNPQAYGSEQMTPEQIAAWQQQFWIPKIATGGYIPPEYDNPEAMAALGQTDAYNQRMQYLAAQGAQRVQTLQDRQAEQRRGGPAALGYAAIGALGGTLGGLAGAGAGAGATGTGSATITGAPIVSGGAAAPAGAAGVGGMGSIGANGAGALSPAAAGAAGGNFLQNWLPYITTGVNSLLGAHAADSAADAESSALQSAIGEQRRQYDQTRADLQPWMTAGQGALNNLQNPAASFAASPGYEWARNEGQRDIGNSFAARGGAASGNALRALTEFNTGLAQQDFGNWWNQQAGLAGVGQNATTNVANFGQNAAGNVGNYLADQGASRASGVMGKYSSLANGLNQGVSNWLYRRRVA